ncbi:MAG: hypothetical protein B6U89_01570 [Desulfurococcales archaeon ex4484_58]|nr:MAG: hypothetical protein B6U89_01570 [Desulfurococcales archaeon ex4484_58]
MVLRLKIKICYRNKCIEEVGIANSGFSGEKPEITLPEEIAKTLFGEKFSIVFSEKILGDGSRVSLAKINEPLELYVVTEDRVEGPVKVYAYMVKSSLILINDKTLSSLRIVIIDPYYGIWCFRDEIGRRERKGVTV